MIQEFSPSEPSWDPYQVYWIGLWGGGGTGYKVKGVQKKSTFLTSTQVVLMYLGLRPAIETDSQIIIRGGGAF